MMLNIALDFQEIPQYLVTEFNFPSTFVAGMFATIIFMAVVCVPFVFRNVISVGIMFASMILFFSVALGWLDAWVAIVQVMLAAGLITFGILKGLK